MAEINVTDSKSSPIMDYINNAFNRIEGYIEDYSPGDTDSAYAIISVSDATLTKGSTYQLENKPMKQTVVFGIYGVSYVKMGYIDIQGRFHVTEDYSDDGTGTTCTIYQMYRRQQ